MVRKIVVVLVTAVFAAFIGACSMAAFPSDNGTPQDPPLPRTASILPLGYGNEWTFSYTDYDGAGEKVRSGEELNLAMPAEYGLLGTSLIPLNPNEQNPTFKVYVYRYEWERTGQGWLLAYRDLDVATPGVYIIGEYSVNSTNVYKTPKLWLAYPASKGTAWDLSLTDSSGAHVYHMKVEETKARFYTPLEGGTSPIRERECYRYSQTSGDGVSHYYYNSDIGPVGYLHYVKGILRSSYIQTSFREYGYYYL